MKFSKAEVEAIIEASPRTFVPFNKLVLSEDHQARSGGSVPALTLAELAASHDVVLVEGHKETPLPKVWLLGPGEVSAPVGVREVLAVLGRDQPRLAITLALCHEFATPRRGWASAGR